MTAHRLAITATTKSPKNATVTITFGCTCGAYDDDVTVGPTYAAARARATGHVRTHARLARGNNAATLSTASALAH